MRDRKIWQSAVARMLSQKWNGQNKRVWQSAVARMLSQKWNGLAAPHVAITLAKELRGSDTPAGCTDLDAVSATVGLSIQYKPLRVDALLHETESGFIAIVNSGANEPRQRFSIAHEIGHVVLSKATGLAQAFGHLSPSEQQSIEASEVEDLCDCFAAELLMPSAAWSQYTYDEGISLTVLRRLMSRYKVSLAAAARQMVAVSVWKCAIMIWTAIYEEERLVELKPVQFWTNIGFGDHSWPKSIPNRQDFRTPGSPLSALEQRVETIGEIPLPFGDGESKYLAQSSIVRVRPTHVATLILAERDGRAILLRARRRSQ